MATKHIYYGVPNLRCLYVEALTATLHNPLAKLVPHSLRAWWSFSMKSRKGHPRASVPVYPETSAARSYHQSSSNKRFNKQHLDTLTSWLFVMI